ncbi:hypothetical protein DIPPA_15555 [Diplonema papillatum]|nr:hypothetical protein DIPPA_15555 [Diplonema papillatum]
MTVCSSRRRRRSQAPFSTLVPGTALVTLAKARRTASSYWPARPAPNLDAMSPTSAGYPKITAHGSSPNAPVIPAVISSRCRAHTRWTASGGPSFTDNQPGTAGVKGAFVTSM